MLHHGWDPTLNKQFYVWMFGEQKSQVMIWNHPIETLPFMNGCLGYQAFLLRKTIKIAVWFHTIAFNNRIIIQPFLQRGRNFGWQCFSKPFWGKPVRCSTTSRKWTETGTQNNGGLKFRWFSFSINWVILRRVRPLIFRFRQFSTKPPGGANYFGITEGFTSPSPRLGAEMATLEKIGGWEPPNLDWRKWLEISTHFYEVEWKSPHICPCIQKKMVVWIFRDDVNWHLDLL